MKAVILYGTRDIRVKEIEKPRIDSNDVLVRVKAAGICGSDVHVYKDASYLEMPQDAILGHEVSGEVSVVGSNVSKIKVGDRIVVEPLLSCGRCGFCAIGQYHLCKELKHIGWQWKGGFAEYVKVPQEKVFKLPESISYEKAALIDGFAVAVHAIQRVKLTVNDIVIILGAGTIGFSILQLVKINGVRKIGLVDLNSKLLMIGKTLGADMIINPRENDLVDKVNELTHGVGADVVFEAVGGTASTLSDAVNIVKPGGSIGAVGSFAKCPRFDFTLFHKKEIDLLSVWSYAKWGTVPEIKIALNLLAEGKIDGEPLITHKFPLNKIKEAFLAAENKEESGAIKVLVIP